MVSKQQKQLQKKKKREQDSRKKVLTLREQIRARAKEEKLEKQRDKRIAKLQREMDQMSVELPDIEEVPDEVLTQLEHNAKILGALEQEHVAEQTARQELNEGLEEKGNKTLDDKMRALRRNFFQANQVGVGGSAQYKMLVAPPRRWKDVSDVEVIRAPVADVEVVKAPDENIVQES